MQTEFEVKCSRCGGVLHHGLYGGSYSAVYIPPCEKCVGDAGKQGYTAGKREGRREGYRDAENTYGGHN